MTWWEILLIVVGALVTGAFLGIVGIMLYIAKGMNW